MKCSSSSKCSAVSTADDEHRLIARYACRLAAAPTATETCRDAIAVGSFGQPLQQPLSIDIATREAMVQQLLHKNRVIAAEIENLKRLRQEAAAAAEQTGTASCTGETVTAADDASCHSGGQEAAAAGERLALCADLLALKQHKSELEEKMGKLRQCRKDLVEQLEGLMRLLRERGEAAAASRTRSPEPSLRLAVTTGLSGGGGGGDESDSALGSPTVTVPKGGGAGMAMPASGVRLLASSSLAGGAELLGAVGEISAAVADLVKEITRTPAGALPFNIPDRS